MAFVAKHKLALVLGSAAVAAFYWYRHTQPVSCMNPASYVGKDGKCYLRWGAEALFDESLDASDVPISFDDNGNALITKPGQL